MLASGVHQSKIKCYMHTWVRKFCHLFKDVVIICRIGDIKETKSLFLCFLAVDGSLFMKG